MRLFGIRSAASDRVLIARAGRKPVLALYSVKLQAEFEPELVVSRAGEGRARSVAAPDWRSNER